MIASHPRFKINVTEQRSRPLGASAAAMIVHSFSPDDLWFADFSAFCELYSAHAEMNALLYVSTGGATLYVGWARGIPAVPVNGQS
jgi:hypothetical protein